MKPHSWITLILGIVFVLFGIIALAGSRNLSGIIPLLIGGSFVIWAGAEVVLQCWSSAIPVLCSDVY